MDEILKDLNVYDVVEVTFCDPASVDGWVDLDKAWEITPVRCQALGYVVGVTRHNHKFQNIVLSLIRSPQEEDDVNRQKEQVNCCFSIPVGCIESLEILRRNGVESEVEWTADTSAGEKSLSHMTATGNLVTARLVDAS